MDLLLRYLLRILPIVLTFGLMGCLFSTRQKVQIPHSVVAITGKASPTLYGQLAFDVLTYIDVKVAIDPKDADLIVEILHDGPGSQIASYSSVGQITGYNIDDVVVFRAFDKAGNELIPETQIYGVRDTNFTAATVLSADIAQQQAITDIRKELAMQIAIRLMSIGRSAKQQ